MSFDGLVMSSKMIQRVAPTDHPLYYSQVLLLLVKNFFK